ncbi:uncharacterized protein B0H18DRAFT_1018892 [Fomitopsis serialis]|uniref:uncharacterized protein n=1 Tax=Fomitopsis serialis TaxID=139415 RepID=UPI0020072ADA|nr:uncharacterized protein B0H18DRAFT_1018892 [Neoantrodia serialis]KAH9922050.1 hypothetical protein B0H18DRAFT_1018892 [Neoantrodia serialis]
MRHSGSQTAQTVGIRRRREGKEEQGWASVTLSVGCCTYAASAGTARASCTIGQSGLNGSVDSGRPEVTSDDRSTPERASNWGALHSCTIASTRGAYQAKHTPNRTPAFVDNTKAKAAACARELQVASTSRRLLYRIWAASTNKRRTDAKHEVTLAVAGTCNRRPLELFDRRFSSCD